MLKQIGIILFYFLMILTTHAQSVASQQAKEIVRQFLLEVRSGKNPDRAHEFMAETVLAHQVTSEAPVTVKRTPANYADHVRETINVYGNYSLEISELIAEGEKVYARWKLSGTHQGETDGFAPTGMPLTEFTSATYVVRNNKIVEYWVQMDRLGMEKQFERQATPKTIDYFQVDVFSAAPFSGNGLTVFTQAERFTKAGMQQITQEMRQFESIFLQQKGPQHFRAYIFAMEEELDFAGHPSLGAAATMHDQLKPEAPKAQWTLELNAKTVTIETERTPYGFMATMNQGTPEFGRVLTHAESLPFLRDLDLQEEDWDQTRPLQVVSTGLPYLLIPLKKGSALKARIVARDLTSKLAPLGAKFVGIVEGPSLTMRTWGNDGVVEDIATGSLAGITAAYFVKYGICRANEPIVLNQGRHLGRPSELVVNVRGTAHDIGNVLVSGGVVKIAKGKYTREAAQTLLK